MALLRNLPVWWATLFRVDPRTFEPQVIDNGEGTGVVGWRVAVPDAASSSKDLTIPYAVRITDVRFVKTTANAGAANTVTVGNAGDAITNALDCNINSKALVDAATFDSNFWTIAAGGTLRVSWVKAGGNSEGVCFIRGVKI